LLRFAVVLAAFTCFAQTSQPAETDLLRSAQGALFAARYKAAAQLYSEALQKQPGGPAACYGLVRALIEDHRSREAYAAAAEALRLNPQTAGVQAAAGLADHRKGDLPKAEEHFRAALRLDPGHAGALRGLSSIESAISQFGKARQLVLAAYRQSPGDPDLMIAHANSLKGVAHITALETALAILDPETEQARNLRAHIANDRAVGDRKLRQLVSPYTSSKIKLFRIMDTPTVSRGVGLRLRLNDRQTVGLMLDTGASGISLSPKIAERAGLGALGGDSADAKGIGDQHPRSSYRYIVSELRVGDVVFANYPVSVFRGAQSSDYDGLIGADVFERFVVTIDFPRLELTLQPRAGRDSEADSDEPVNAGPPAAGFHRILRFGDDLAVSTLINDGPPRLFLLDSGSSDNLIDTEIGGESSSVRRDDLTTVQGIQGIVKQVSRADRVSLVFAGFRQDNSTLVAISLERMSDSMGVAFGGILGMPVLGQLRVSLDYREGTLRLEYRK